MARMSKKKTLQRLEIARAEEEKRIINLLKDEGIFTSSLQPLIENYLDAFVIYKKMFEAWMDEGFPQTKLHENKAGAINEMKHPLAGQVETWLDKKNKMLESLGMTNKGKSVQKAEKNSEKDDKIGYIDELAAHRNKWRGSG